MNVADGGEIMTDGHGTGTGLFVSSGVALATGGPAALLIAFGLIGIMLFCTVQALGEMAVLFPVAGSFSAYSTRFLDPAWGFAMGWKSVVILPDLDALAHSLQLCHAVACRLAPRGRRRHYCASVLDTWEHS